MSVAVVTASLPERAARLAEAAASVAAQTAQPAAHLIGVDYARRGPEAVRNDLVAGATTDWVAFLDDDDLLFPHHLATLLAASADADVVYSFCEVEGRGGWTPNHDFDAAVLRSYNFIPVTALVRRAAFVLAGGFAGGTHPTEDWDLWRRLLDGGAVFRCVPEVTWRYRFHGANATTRR